MQLLFTVCVYIEAYVQQTANAKGVLQYKFIFQRQNVNKLILILLAGDIRVQ